jgi:hypothetical protein
MSGLDQKRLATMDLPFRGSNSTCVSLKTSIGSKIEWSRNTGYRSADKPYRANNTLLRIATIRKGTIELMQNAASTARSRNHPEDITWLGAAGRTGECVFGTTLVN